MAPKPKKSNVEENPFLPPPVDLDRIPLADKDYLILETQCEFDVAELQSWFKDTFIDQSDEIGLWESNTLCIFFPKSTIFQNLPSNAKCTTSPIRES
jgi:hypothetical protein